jgi:ABC-type amino acid transport substrate-binding protein
MIKTSKRVGLIECVITLFALSCVSVQANETVATEKLTIKSSVSAEFPDGVHFKYLTFLADELDMELAITHMTYNRRITSLRSGVIDIMTGLRSTFPENGDFVYLQPSYTSTSNAYFIRNDQRTRLSTIRDLDGKTIAITANDKPYISALEKLGAKVVVILSLEQKIKLLQRKRIDAFEHVQSSGLSEIAKKGLSEQIIVAPYKTASVNHFHFALSTGSELMSRKSEIEAIIARAVEMGTFAKIRAEHYKNGNNAKK